MSPLKLAPSASPTRRQLEYTPLAAAFCPPQFTVAQLRRVYEIVWDTTLAPRNFHSWWGHVTIKVSGHPPFPAQGILNGDEPRAWQRPVP